MWVDSSADRVYLFDRLILSTTDAGHALLNLVADVDANLLAEAAENPMLDAAISEAAAQAEDPTPWLPAMRPRLTQLMGHPLTEPGPDGGGGLRSGHALELCMGGGPPVITPNNLSLCDDCGPFVLQDCPCCCGPKEPGCGGGGPGPCAGSTDPCCGSTDPCCGNPDPCCGIDCDDGDPCTGDECVDGDCVFTPIVCDDNDPCTDDACVGGGCVFTPKDCDDGDSCTQDDCDPATGECTHIFVQDPNDFDCDGILNDDENPGCENDPDPCCGDFDCDGIPDDLDPDDDNDEILDVDENPGCEKNPDPCCGVVCDDGNPCTRDFCSPGSGDCVYIGDPCWEVDCIVTPNDPCCPGGGDCEVTCEVTGYLGGGGIAVESACLVGETLTFTLSGVTDSGGFQRLADCSVATIPPATPQFTWEITPPMPLAPVSGSGPVATITVADLGDYSATFTATVARTCAPAPITIGPQTATVGTLDLEFVGVAEAAEESPGGFLCVNDDDDDNNGVPDKDQTGAILLEDDLQAFSMIAAGLDPSVMVTLSITTGGSMIRVYEDFDRTSPVTLPAEWPADMVPAICWIEGIAPSGAARDVELKLEAAGAGGMCEDIVQMTVLDVSISAATFCGNSIATNNLFNEGKTDGAGNWVPDNAGASPVTADGTSIAFDGLVSLNLLVAPSLAGLPNASITIAQTTGTGSVRVLATRFGGSFPFDDDWVELPLSTNLIPILNQIAGQGGIWVYWLEGLTPGSVELTLTVDAGTNQCQKTISLNVVEYPIVEIRYKTFIAPQVIETFPNFLLDDYFLGDDRWFGYQASPSKTFQSTWVCVNPVNSFSAAGEAGPQTQSFGQSTSYTDAPDGSDVTPCPHCAPPFGDFCLLPGATSECVQTAVAGQGGNLLSVNHQRVSSSQVSVQLDAVGYLPCTYWFDPTVPAIDLHLTIEFSQTCLNGQLGPMEFRLSGNHDGFPWHELYINGVIVYEHDVCCTQESPFALVGSGEWYYMPSGPSDLCHNPILGVPLQNWQAVPGLSP